MDIIWDAPFQDFRRGSLCEPSRQCVTVVAVANRHGQVLGGKKKCVTVARRESIPIAKIQK